VEVADRLAVLEAAERGAEVVVGRHAASLYAAVARASRLRRSPGVNDGHPGNESLRVSGTFRPAGDGIIDPVATGAQVTLRSRKDGSTIAIDLPAGAGWRADKSGNAFTFTDRRPGGTAGVRRMTVRRRDDGTLRVGASTPSDASGSRRRSRGRRVRRSRTSRSSALSRRTPASAIASRRGRRRKRPSRS